MPMDMNIWRNNIRQAVDSIADEQYQRRAWFGGGPEESSPTEEYCMLFDNGAIEDFLCRNDAGLNQYQIDSGKHLVELMNQLSKTVPKHINPSDLIDDPRWVKIRQAAKDFLAML